MEKYNSYQGWNNNKSWCEYENCHLYVKGYIWNPCTSSCENI